MVPPIEISLRENSEGLNRKMGGVGVAAAALSPVSGITILDFRFQISEEQWNQWKWKLKINPLYEPEVSGHRNVGRV